MLFCKACSLRNAVDQGDELTHSCIPITAALTALSAQRCATWQKAKHLRPALETTANLASPSQRALQSCYRRT